VRRAKRLYRLHVPNIEILGVPASWNAKGLACTGIALPYADVGIVHAVLATTASFSVIPISFTLLLVVDAMFMMQLRTRSYTNSKRSIAQ